MMAVRVRLRISAPGGSFCLLLVGLLLGALGDCAPAVRGASSVAPLPAPPSSAGTPITALSAITIQSRSLRTPPRTASVPASSGSFVTRLYVSPAGERMIYYLYVPHPYDPARTYPLVLLLHGGGEVAKASKTLAQNAHVLLSQHYVRVWASPTVQQRWPCFVVVPQVEAPARWVNVAAKTGSYTLATVPSESLLLAQSILTALQQQYPTINTRRIYLTGLSMGGYGAWEMAERWPGTFAAVAPIAGAGDPSLAYELATVPVWAFQGAGDPVVPISGTRDMIHAIEASGGHPRYTEFSGGGHEIWGKVYSDPRFLDWLFSQESAPLRDLSSP